MIASDELRARKQAYSRQFSVTASQLAFLQSVETEESLLAQRLKDIAMRPVLRLINGAEDGPVRELSRRLRMKLPRPQIRILPSARPTEKPFGKFMESFEWRSVLVSYDLLSEPKAARMAYFTGLTIAHPLLAQAYERLRHAVSEASSDSLIFVFGPSGVGKTTMMRRFERHLIEEMSQELTADRGQIPAVSVEAVAPDSGGFNWKDFYKRLLVGLEEPLVDRKIKPDKQDEPRPSHQRPMTCRTVAIAEWRMAVERALHYRRPRAILIDEAQHMAKMAAGRRLQDQLIV